MGWGACSHPTSWLWACAVLRPETQTQHIQLPFASQIGPPPQAVWDRPVLPLAGTSATSRLQSGLPRAPGRTGLNHQSDPTTLAGSPVPSGKSPHSSSLLPPSGPAYLPRAHQTSHSHTLITRNSLTPTHSHAHTHAQLHAPLHTHIHTLVFTCTLTLISTHMHTHSHISHSHTLSPAPAPRLAPASWPLYPLFLCRNASRGPLLHLSVATSPPPGRLPSRARPVPWASLSSGDVPCISVVGDRSHAQYSAGAHSLCIAWITVYHGGLLGGWLSPHPQE